MVRHLVVAALALSATVTAARQYEVSPASPVALELVHLQAILNGCERLRGVEPIDGGFRVNIQARTTGMQCDDLTPFSFTLGAFPPGTYRITTRITCNDCSPPVFDEPPDTTITVAPAPASSAPLDDIPVQDLSGVWTAASEPYTGFTFIASAGLDAQGRRNGRITGLWYDYSGTQPTWSVILLDGPTGPIMRAVPSGTGANRTVTFVPVGTATLASNAMRPLATPWRLTGTIDGRPFDLMLERFRWTRYAWPARAPEPQ
ncbi:MAG TPA: hypothetical protein VFL14_05215 [Xanthomonadales bacterium]|nr:hypothetical protein [Xanthomonadales bacterium]